MDLHLTDPVNMKRLPTLPSKLIYLHSLQLKNKGDNRRYFIFKRKHRLFRKTERDAALMFKTSNI